MNSEPRVSVIMAAYNAEKYLREAVDSVLAQTLTEFELIVVDDASTDGTRAIIGSYSDPRIRALYNSSNLGQSVSRNKAIAATRAQYIAVLDADDLALPTRLERQAKWLDRHPEVGLLGSYGMTVDEQGNDGTVSDYSPIDDAGVKWRLLSSNPIIHVSAMMRKSVLELTGGYTSEDSVRRAFVEDYELLSRVNRYTRSAVLPEVLVKYRWHTHSEQDMRVEDVARRNVAWLTGYPVSDAAWEGLRRMNLNWAPLSAEEARAALALEEAKHVAFARRYLDPDSARERLRRYRLLWARRAFAQARRNPYLDDRCRSVMLRAAGKLLAGLVSVPRFSRRADSSEKIVGTIL